MNNSYNYSDFPGTAHTADQESQRYEEQLELRQVSSHETENQAENNIEAMLFSHSKYYIYCE